MPSLEPCDVPGNAIVYYNRETGLVNKHDFFMNADLNLSRDAPDIAGVSRAERSRASTASILTTIRYTRGPWRYPYENVCLNVV